MIKNRPALLVEKRLRELYMTAFGILERAALLLLDSKAPALRSY